MPVVSYGLQTNIGVILHETCPYRRLPRQTRCSRLFLRPKNFTGKIVDSDTGCQRNGHETRMAIICCDRTRREVLTCDREARVKIIIITGSSTWISVTPMPSNPLLTSLLHCAFRPGSGTRSAVEFGGPSECQCIGSVLHLALKTPGSTSVEREQRHAHDDDQQDGYVRKYYSALILPK